MPGIDRFSKVFLVDGWIRSQKGEGGEGAIALSWDTQASKSQGQKNNHNGNILKLNFKMAEICCET